MNNSQIKDSMLVFAPALQLDPEATTWSFFKSLEHGRSHQFTEEISMVKPTSGEPKQQKNIIERLSGIIDTEDPKFDKIKRENYQKIEENVENICEDMYSKQNQFYECQNSLAESVQHSIVKKRLDNAPELDEFEKAEELSIMAAKPWIFQTLPGIQSVNIESLQKLNQKLQEIQELAFWNEPIEITNGGPEFFSKLKSNLLTKKDTNDETRSLQAEIIKAIFGIATLSGNQDLLLDVLDTFSQFYKLNSDQADQAFKMASQCLCSFINQIKDFSNKQTYQHAFLRQNISRVFGIGSMYPTQGLTERNTSITTDGTYLYLAIGIHKRAQLYKIGTGDGNTIPGKVYVQTQFDREGDITWVYCQQKIYLRRATDEFGSLVIYDPVTLSKVGDAKLFLADMPHLLSQNIEQTNRNYPLLVDPSDNTLCILTVNLVKRDRKVKPDQQSQFDVLAKKKADDLKSKPPVPVAESEEDLRKLPRQEQLKRQKEKMKRGGPKGEPPGPPFGDVSPSNIFDPSTYSVLQFELHKFDTSGNYRANDKAVSDNISAKKDFELLKEPLISEMYFSFSGFFSAQDCARALSYNKNDIETATNWLVAEKEKPSNNICFRRVSTVLISESQVAGRFQSEMDTMAKQGSLLMINSIQSGHWTINDNQVTYHQNSAQDVSTIQIFSTDQTKKRELNIQSTNIEGELLDSRLQHKREQQVILSQIQNGGAPQYYFDGVQWAIMSIGQVTAMIDSCRSANKELPNFMPEDDLYEPIILYGTHISSLSKQRAIDQNFSSYITYCSEVKRFYSLVLGSSQRLVYSAPDLSFNSAKFEQDSQPITGCIQFIKETLQVLNKVESQRWRMPWRWSSWTHLFKNALNTSTLQQHQLPSFMMHSLPEETQNKTKLKKIKKRLEMLQNIELEQVLKELKLVPSQPSQKPQAKQAKQKQLKPVQKDQQSTSNLQESLAKPQFFNEPPMPLPQNWGNLNQPPLGWESRPPGFPPHERIAEIIQKDPGNSRLLDNPFLSTVGTFKEYQSAFQPPQSAFQRPQDSQPIQRNPNNNHGFGFSQQNHFGEPPKQYNSFLPPPDFKKQGLYGQQHKIAQIHHDNYVLPTELVCIPIELSKTFTYCSTGQLTSLSSLISLYKTTDHCQEVLDSILIWITNATYLSTHKTQQCTELYQLCIDIISTNQTIENTATATVLRILTVGWWLFATDTPRQLQILDLILKVQNGPVDDALVFSTSLLLDSNINATAMQIFASRFCQQASFYDLEILNVRKVIPHVLLVKTNHQSQTLGLPINQLNEQIEEQDENEPLANLRPRCFKYASDLNYFALFPKSQQSITETPFENLQLRKVPSKSRRGASPLDFQYSGQSYSLINQAYFAVPLACCLCTDIIDSLSDPSQITFENIIKLYVTDQSEIEKLSSHEEKFTALKNIRDQVKLDQQRIIQIFKQKIQQNCQASIQIFAFLLGQAFDWTDFSIPNLTNLIFDALEIAVAHPKIPLLNQILIALSRVLGCSSEAYVAYNALPKLQQLISGFSKQPIKLEKEQSEGLDASRQQVYETPHPYPKNDTVPMKRNIREPGAIGYTVEFDPRCSTENPGDVLILKSSDYNYLLTDAIGTEFRFDRKPHTGQVFIMIGEQLHIEFRIMNHRASRGQRPNGRGGRGGPQNSSTQQTREELNRRWGYKLTIKPIFGLSKFGEENIHQALIQNSLVQITNNLALALTEGQFTDRDENYSEITLNNNESNIIKKTLNWHLFKGGIKINELENYTNFEVVINQGLSIYGKFYEDCQEAIIKCLKSGKEFVQNIDPIQILTNQAQNKTSIQFVPQEKVWASEVKTLMESPETLKEIVKKIRMQVPYPITIQQQMIKRSFSQHKDKWDKVEQLLTVSMLYHSGSLQDANKYAELKKETIVRGIQQSDLDEATQHLLEEFSLIGRHINVVLNWMLARLQGQSEFQIIIEDTLQIAQTMISDKLVQKQKEETEKQNQKREQNLMASAERETVEYNLSIDSKLKEENIKADSLQPSLSQSSKNAVVTKVKTKSSMKKRTNIVKLTESIQKGKGKKPKSKEEQKKEEIPTTQQTTMIDTTYNHDVEEESKYCELSQTELADLKSKILTKSHQDFIDNYQIDGDLSKLLNLCMFFDLDLNVSDLQESLKAVFKRVKLRIKPLIDLDSPQDHKVPRIVDIKDLKLGSAAEEVAQDVTNRLLLLLEIRPSINYQSEVTRISNKRQMTTIVEQDEDIQSQLSGHQQSLVSQPDSDEDDLMEDLQPLTAVRSMSLPTNVISGISKLAATNQPPPALKRARKQSAEYAVFIDSYRKWRIWSRKSQDEDEDLLSPNGSPLHGVVAFAKMSKIFDPETLRDSMKAHIYRAAFRLAGLQYQEKLFSMLQDGPFSRFLWGQKAFSLHKSVLNDIETCGESMARQLNAVSRQIVQQLMSQVVNQLKSMGQRFQQQQNRQRKQKLPNTNEPSVPIQPVGLIDLKRLLLTLNDIRIMLSNIYTKEYVLESLRNDKKISARNTLGVDQIQIFLKAVVNILVKSQGTQFSLYIQISQVSKLILDLFIRQSDSVKTETQRILLEMLLDTVVTQLQVAEGNDKMQLLQLLSEIIRISSRSDSETTILQPGSIKVSNCVKLLTKFICNYNEVPAVVRYAIRCAKLLFKQFSLQNNDKLFCKEVLKAIGYKILQHKQSETKQTKNFEESESQPQPEISNEVVIETNNQVIQQQISELKAPELPLEYFVFGHLNIPHEEDFTFLLTALYHWEQNNPIYSNNLFKKFEDIVKVVPAKKTAAPITQEKLPPINQPQPLEPKPIPQVELIEQIISQQLAQDIQLVQPEDRKEEQVEGDKDWQTESSHSGDEKLEPMDVINQVLLAQKAQPESADQQQDKSQQQEQVIIKMQNLMERMAADMDDDSEQMAHLVKQHQQLEQMIMQQSVFSTEGSHEQVQKIQEQIEVVIQRINVSENSGVPKLKGRGPPAAPAKNPAEKVSAGGLKISYIQLAVDEIIKLWKAPLDTDSDQVKEKKLKEINFLKMLSLITQEAVSYASQFYHQRNSLVFQKRSLTLEKADEFCNILKMAYNGKLDPIPANPYSESVDLSKKLTSVNQTQADLFPLLPKKVKELGKQDNSKLLVQPQQINVAPKRFNTSIIEKNQNSIFEKEMSSKLQEIKLCQKSQRMGPIVHSKSKKQKFGFSISSVIGDLVLFFRGLSGETLVSMFNSSLRSYLSDSYQINLLFGVLVAFGGWNYQISTGTQVEVKTNEQWCKGTVVEPGIGKKNVIVILDDDSLTLQKVLHNNVRVYSEILSVNPDKKLLFKSVIKAQNDPFLLCLMLRACSQVDWSSEESDPDYSKFIAILIQVSKSGNHFDEDVSKQQYENTLTLLWERIIDLNEQKNSLIFNPKDPGVQQQEEQQKQQSTGSKKEGIQNNDYAQMQNSYLTGLPEAVAQQSKSEANLKLLYYWEKNIIPQILNFCQGTYRPYEFEYYFEQVRYHLRRGDSASAINDAMTMLEHKIPPGMIIPDENQDWTSKIIEECIVGNWFLAKIKSKNNGTETDSTSSRLYIQKLIQLGVEEVLVQIKAVDGRSNAVLAEYIDHDNMQCHYFWSPITNLKSLFTPLPSQSTASLSTLQDQLNIQLQSMSSVYCRETLTRLVQQQKQIPSADLRIEELISWSVWQNFTSDALTGWMENFSASIQLPSSKIQNKQNESKTPSLQQILNKQIEKFANENKNIQQVTNETDSTSMLSVLSEMMEQVNNQKNLIDWCATLWYAMGSSVSQNRCVVDVCKEYEQYSKSMQKSLLLPLHELIPSHGNSSVGTLLMFKKNGVKLAPCSKVQFFADPEMVNLIHELNAGSEIKKEVPPIILKYSHIWVFHDAGTNALLSKEDQLTQLGENVSSSLQTAIVSIPKEWQIACWLTETLSTSILKKETMKIEHQIEVFQKLINSLQVFYEDSKSPNVIKSVVLKLLSRLVIKLRFIINKHVEEVKLPNSHYERVFISKDFIKNLLSEIMIQMESEDCLHCAFVQDAIEFLMVFVIPVGKQKLKTHSQLLEDIEIPQWITPIIHVSYYLHYFRGEIESLPEDTFSIENDPQYLDQIVVVQLQNLPVNYKADWVLEKVKQTIMSHQGRILQLPKDFVLYKDHLIVLLDGWHPLKPTEIQEIVDSDVEETKEVKPKIVELPKPTVFNCQMCTFENSLNSPSCNICASPRPPMDVILEEWRKANAPPEEPKAQKVVTASPSQLRLESLAADIRSLISKDQKRKLISQQNKTDAVLEDQKQEETDEDHKSETSDKEPEIDLNNLPSDPEERFKLLGIDLSLLDTGEQDLIMAIEMSAISEIQERQHVKKQEKAAKLAEKQAAKKLREKELERQKIQESGGKIFKLTVVTGQNVFQDAQTSQIVQEFLRDRIKENHADEFDLNKSTKSVIEQIHKNWKSLSGLSLPKDESLLEDLEITEQSFKQADLETLQEMFKTLALADIKLFYKVLQSQGYDVWLTQASLPNTPNQTQMRLIRNVSQLEKVKRLIEQDICQESKLVTSLEPYHIRLTSLLGPDFANCSFGYYDESQITNNYPELCEQISQAEIRYMWAMLKKFNEYYAPVVPYINQSDTKQSVSDWQVLPMTIATYMSQTRDMCFKCVKTDLRHLILERTVQPRDQAPKLYFERLKLAEGAQEGVTDSNEKQKKKSKSTESQFMFTQAHNQIKELDIGLLRPKKPQGAEPHIAFEIVFKNEHVVGEGGPYRQFFADVSKELQPSRLERGTQQQLLDLLGPCANQRDSEKVGKDRFVIQNSSSNQTQLSQYEFLGILMGICIRTGANLILDLPQIFWKQLVGQKITLDDLYEIEVKLVNNLKQMLQQSEDEFDLNELYWTTMLSDGSQVDLKPKGSQTKVKYEELTDYISETIMARLRESQPQYNSIKRGISKVIPQSLFNIVTAKELEIWVCGKPHVDIDLLRRHTKYQGGSDAYNEAHPVIVNFWLFLTQLREDEKQKFIKFCWGQERIPANDEAFANQNVRFMIKPAPKTDKKKQIVDQDQLLPHADTCFFNFELPAYSSIEVMRAKIIQAITIDCVSMNAEDQQHRDQGNDMSGRNRRQDEDHPEGMFDDDDY